MKDWKHATQEEVDAMTFEEAVEIVQKQIDMGEKKVGDGGEWCARAHTTQAYQLVLHRALHANGVRESLMATLKRNHELRDENTRLRYILWEIINETHKDHYGDSALAYSIICDMLSEAEKQMREANNSEE